MQMTNSNSALTQNQALKWFSCKKLYDAARPLI